jgi:hypothetical protein
MPGIIVTALITAVFSTLVWGGVLLFRAPRPTWRLLVLCFLLQLPMSAAAYYLVRIPLDGAIHGLLGDTTVYRWGRLLYAPITEELAKLWPLLIPWIATRVTRENAAVVAAALGVGFGVGEIGLLAEFVRANPTMAGYPWYFFTGFIGERFMVCMIHGLFVAMVLFGWKCWRIGFAGGLVLAMALHFALNFPIGAASAGWFGTDTAMISSILSLWVALFFVAAVVVLLILDKRLAGLPSPTQPVACPKCGQTFQRSLIPMNLGIGRLERCPNCKKLSVV